MINQTFTSRLMREVNTAAVLELVRRRSPIARTQIAQTLQMSLPAVMRIIDRLMAENLVCASGESERTGGRRRPLLAFNGQAQAVIGVDVGGTKMFGAVADLAGRVQHEIYRPHDGDPKTEGLAWLTGLIQQLIDAPRPEGQQVRGIAVGLPSITLARQGIVKWAPTFGWRDLPLRDILAERFSAPIFVENDVNLATLGEWGFGTGQGMQNLVYMFIGTGIGGGLILDGQLYRGHNQAAGELGWMAPNRAALRRNAVAGFGGLESLIAGQGLAEQAMARHPADPPLTAAEVFAAARSGQAWAVELLDETIDYLSIAIANISCILNPEAIIIGGGLAEAADLLLEPVRARLQTVIQFIPQLMTASLGRHAAVLGAVTLVLQATTQPYVVKSL